MKTRSQWWQVFVVLAGSLLLLTACGGGGGGGDDGPSIPSTYTGLTTQATLTQNNAVEIVSGAVGGSMIAEDVGDVVPLAAQDMQISGGLQVSNLFKELALQAISPEQSSVSPLTTESSTELGDCGGSVSYTITINDSSGAITGSFTFDAYCSQGVTIDGVMPISGSATTDVLKIKMVFDDISVTSDTMSQTLTSGTATFALYDTKETETLNYVLIDNTSLQTFFISNYVLSITYGATSDAATFTGRYYHPDYGYVGISTLTTLTVPDTALPTGGTVRFSGSGSRADLTFNADQSTLLQLDTNNDGTYEFSFDNPL